MFSDAGALWNYSDWTSFSGVAGKGFAVFSMGVAGIDAAANVATLGGKSLVTGGIKTAGKQIIKAEVKNVAEDLAVNIIKNPHNHHVLFKKGVGAAQQAIVEEGQAILVKYGIDPIKGIENLVTAPNVAGQHTLANVTEVVE